MWTLFDDDKAWSEGWWIGPDGIVGAREHVIARAAEGSDLHIRALQHIGFCKLTNTSPVLQDMHWTATDQNEADQEGWWLISRQLHFDPSFYPSKKVFKLYMEQNAYLFHSTLHAKALRNTR